MTLPLQEQEKYRVILILSLSEKETFMPILEAWGIRVKAIGKPLPFMKTYMSIENWG